MFHLTFRARPDTLLFHTHVEGRALWDQLERALPERVAACLMPNHGHVQLPHDDPGGKLGVALGAYAQWRNRHRGESGAVFTRTSPAEPIADTQKADTVRRYIELNPCRARLVDDPLRWPWSTAREAVGLAVGGPPVAQPQRYFAWLAADPSVRPGAELPRVRFDDFAVDDVLHAVCAYFRVPLDAAEERGSARTYTFRTAMAHGLAAAGVAERLRCDRGTVRRAAAGVPSRASRIADPILAACVRLVGDERFRALSESDLRTHRGSLRFRR